MNKFIRFYNQNRHMFWIVIVTIIGIIAIIQVLNKLASNKIQINNTNSVGDNSTSTINTDYSVITGQEIENDKAEIIEEFISFCNNNQTEKAYEILSEDCKEILYPTLNDFIENYYNKIFETKKTYACQAWITGENSYTYRIDFVQDMLATGEPSKTSILDYYTVVKSEDNEYKLNINKFIGIKDINKTATSNNVTVNILRKRIYKDYEIYDIEVTNKTQNTIMLDDMKSTKSIYLENNNEQKYYWYSHEVLESDITIKEGLKQKVEIKFNKTYNPKKEVNKIVFSNIALDNKVINVSVEI